MLQNLLQELLGSWLPGIAEKLLGRCLFHNLTAIHKDHAVGHGFCKAHLVCDADHGHSAAGKLNHYIQHFLDHFRVQCRGGLIEQHDLRLHTQRSSNGHPLLLTTG